MTLATRCPNCTTTFRVVSDQLKLRKGLVKCGRCTHVFNGVEHLRYYSADEASVSTIVPKEADAPPEDAVQPALDPAREAAESKIDSPYAPEPHESVSDKSPAKAGPAEVVRAEPLGDTPSRSPSPPPDPTPTPPPKRSGDSWFGGTSARQSPIDPLSPLTLLDFAPDGVSAASRPVDDSEIPGFLNDRKRPKWLENTLRAGIAVSVVALVAQASFFWRDELAARWPGLRSPLVFACEVFSTAERCEISLPRRITQLRIASAELQAANNPGQYTLVVTLHNDSSLPQAWPSIDLVLADVRNTPVTRRSIAVDEYMKSADETASKARAGLTAGADETINIPLKVEGPIVGYTVGIYYP